MNKTSAAFAPSYHIPNGAPAIDMRVFGGGEGDAIWAAPRLLRPLPVPRRQAAPARRPAEKPKLQRSSGGRFLAPFAVALLAAATMAILAGRERVARAVPAASPIFAAIGLPVNPLGMAIEDVRARLGDFGGRKVMVVDGSIVNLRGKDAKAPDLRIALRGQDGRELYAWTTHAPKNRLGKAERVHFAARLEAPPDGVEDAAVSFVGAMEGS
jgi:hypothetical protein